MAEKKEAIDTVKVVQKNWMLFLVYVVTFPQYQAKPGNFLSRGNLKMTSFKSSCNALTFWPHS